MSGQPTLHLMVGLPCSGKTTRARALQSEADALLLTPDVWHLRLFGHDFPSEAHDARHNEIEAIMWDVAKRALALGTSVILDFGFWAREERDFFREQAAKLGALSKTHYMKATDEQLLSRMRTRTAGVGDTFAFTEKDLEEWRSLFQEPTEDELDG